MSLLFLIKLKIYFKCSTLLCFFPEEMPENHYKDVDIMYTITIINKLEETLSKNM